MTGRFGKLETQQRLQQETQPEQGLGTPVRTPTHDLGLASEAWRAGHYENALQMFTRVLRNDRSMTPAWVGQVQMLVELQEYPEARLWADKALELFKNHGDLLAAKAQACLRQGDGAAAVVCSDLSIQSPGTSAFRWRVRGEVLLGKAADRARSCFEKSFSEPGADWFDRVVVARVYLFYAMPAAALQHAQMGVDLQPSHPFAWLILGKCQESLGMRDRAVTSYERSKQLPGGNADASAALIALENTGGFLRFRRWFGGMFSR